MSIQAGSNLLLTRDFTVNDSIVIDELIRSICDEVIDTRKGRHWEAYLHKLNVGLTVHVTPTGECLHDCEEELLDLNLLPEDAPECISIIANLGTENDLKTCQLLTHRICEELDCLTSGAKYFS